MNSTPRATAGSAASISRSMSIPLSTSPVIAGSFGPCPPTDHPPVSASCCDRRNSIDFSIIVRALR